jgi:hypothetical protein
MASIAAWIAAVSSVLPSPAAPYCLTLYVPAVVGVPPMVLGTPGTGTVGVDARGGDAVGSAAGGTVAGACVGFVPPHAASAAATAAAALAIRKCLRVCEGDDCEESVISPVPFPAMRRKRAARSRITCYIIAIIVAIGVIDNRSTILWS